MCYAYLHSCTKLLLVPGFALLRWNLSGQHCDVNTLPRENHFQPPRHIAFLRVGRIHLSLSSARKVGFDAFDHLSLLGVDDGSIEIVGSGYQKLYSTT